LQCIARVTFVRQTSRWTRETDRQVAATERLKPGLCTNPEEIILKAYYTKYQGLAFLQYVRTCVRTDGWMDVGEQYATMQSRASRSHIFAKRSRGTSMIRDRGSFLRNFPQRRSKIRGYDEFPFFGEPPRYGKEDCSIGSCLVKSIG